MRLYLDKCGGRTIDFGGATIEQDVTIYGHTNQVPHKPGLKLVNFTLTSNLTMVRCCQCVIENARFLGSTLRVMNGWNAWSENNTFRDLTFVESEKAIEWDYAGGRTKSFARQHVSNIFLSRCKEGLDFSRGSVYGSMIEHVRGNFADDSVCAMRLGGNMRATMINNTNFEGGSDNTQLFVGIFERPAFRPIVTNAFYHGHEKQVGWDIFEWI